GCPLGVCVEPILEIGAQPARLGHVLASLADAPPLEGAGTSPLSSSAVARVAASAMALTTPAPTWGRTRNAASPMSADVLAPSPRLPDRRSAAGTAVRSGARRR